LVAGALDGAEVDGQPGDGDARRADISPPLPELPIESFVAVGHDHLIPEAGVDYEIVIHERVIAEWRIVRGFLDSQTVPPRNSLDVRVYLRIVQIRNGEDALPGHVADRQINVAAQVDCL